MNPLSDTGCTVDKGIKGLFEGGFGGNSRHTKPDTGCGNQGQTAYADPADEVTSSYFHCHLSFQSLLARPQFLNFNCLRTLSNRVFVKICM